MITIDFTEHILGHEAAGQLRRRKVMQTLRSETAAITRAVLDGQVQVDDTILISLDSEALGQVLYKACHAKKWADITEMDAHLGGFASRRELEKALLRAGFRFKPLDEYTLYRHQFVWL